MRAIFFDVDGVLVHGYHAKPERRVCWDERLEEDLGISREVFKRDFISGPFINEVLVGRKGLQEALEPFLAGIGSSVTAADFMEYWLTRDANVNQALLEKVKLLKKSGQVRLFIATNQAHSRATYLMETIGFNKYFEDIYHSALLGTMKPDPAYFEGITTMLGGFDEPPVFFDDTQAVVDAANAYGWEAHQYDDVADLGKSDFVRMLLSAGDGESS